MKKIIYILLSICIFYTPWFAFESENEITRETIFQNFSQNILLDTPKSYQYIQLNFVDLQKNDTMYPIVQKLVYRELIWNKKSKINLKSPLNSLYFYTILEKKTGYDFVNNENIQILKSKNTTYGDLVFSQEIIKWLKKENVELAKVFWDEKWKIFQDVYFTLLKNHYDSSQIDKDKLIYSSIEWLAKWVGDKFTTYFPPSESKNFQESLAWEFEWIWAYVDFETPWELRIIAPLPWSPSEKIWIHAWDIIRKINGVLVTKKMTIQEVVSMIKWPSGTKVILEVQRWEEKLQFEVIRQKIIINDVDYKIIENTFFYIQMKIFWDKIFTQTKDALVELQKHKEIKKIIIDLRNNPGGYLEKAIDILSLFVKKWLPITVVKYKDSNISYDSYGYNTISLDKYEVYILTNAGTASASEIVIWTLKDYFPKIQIIWEKTYGKWSVQTIKPYSDGSSIKYTIAKWYTWKSITGIDGVWISPDILVKWDLPKEKSWSGDIQLDYIIHNFK